MNPKAILDPKAKQYIAEHRQKSNTGCFCSKLRTLTPLRSRAGPVIDLLHAPILQVSQSQKKKHKKSNRASSQPRHSEKSQGPQVAPQSHSWSPIEQAILQLIPMHRVPGYIVDATANLGV